MAEHREQTYDALLDAVDQLVIERGFEAMTISEIASRAGITRTAVYNYATDKAELLVRAVERRSAGVRSAASTLIADSTKSVATRMEGLIRLITVDLGPATGLVILRGVHTHLSPSLVNHTLGDLRDDVAAYLATLHEEGVAARIYPPPTDSALTTRLTAGVVDAAVVEAINRPFEAGAVASAAAAFIEAAWSGPHGTTTN